MKQEDRELLVIDLCGRIPYEVIVCVNGTSNVKLASVSYWEEVEVQDGSRYLYDISDIKPYLFPMSSMTREQLYELREIFGFEIEFSEDFIELSTFHHNCLGYLEMVSLFEWFNKNHFDYRRLISKGLAIDCTNLNIY